MSITTEEIVEKLKSITLLEAAELVTEIEQTFGVDASASVAGGAASITGETVLGNQETPEEKLLM